MGTMGTPKITYVYLAMKAVQRVTDLPITNVVLAIKQHITTKITVNVVMFFVVGHSV